MSYLVFARKFRPQNFDEILGQETITTTLKNAIKQNRVSQSFLFSGPRGVGKTSTARILAKALNCQKGPTEEPCGKCPACKEIEEGRSMDVLEIDGASNRGIEEIRGLRETVKFKPAAGSFKIYIIDEVHMLTTEAFNALLKTLEEPPPHVKFIFATTESHKVPLTILSRCQRFQFKRISVADVAKKLEEIAQKEKLKYEKNVFLLIAKATEGAMRDAESLLDQLASFSDGEIKEQDVLTLLGLASEDLYLDTVADIKGKNGKKVFDTVQKLYEDGADMGRFVAGIFEVFRHILLLKTAPKSEALIDLSKDGLEKTKSLAEQFTGNELLLALSLIQNLQGSLRRPVVSERLLTESTLLKLIYLDGLREVEKIIPAAVSQTQNRINSNYVKTIDEQIPMPTISDTQTQNDFSGDMNSLWAKTIEQIQIKKGVLAGCLLGAKVLEVNTAEISLSIFGVSKFNREQIERVENKAFLEETLSAVFGRPLKANITYLSSVAADRSGKSQEESFARERDSEIIAKAKTIFPDAKIVNRISPTHKK